MTQAEMKVGPSSRFYGLVGGMAILLIAGLVFTVARMPRNPEQNTPAPQVKPTYQFQAGVETELAAIRDDLKALQEGLMKSCVQDVASQVNYMNGENCRTMDQHLFEMKKALEQCLEKQPGGSQVYWGGAKGTL